MFKKNKLMKKTYMAPVTKEQKIELNHIICVSGTLSNESITDVNNVGARRNGSLWDDDDDEY
mgnify:CR=1 FL=1